ncbi:MAG: hypothetical protein COA90_09510 [Gammaproteobacteria bacterium]|nr:MAG: hypothetical protein COA90_09510 [Gammaproteobacteria bacterium]
MQINDAQLATAFIPSAFEAKEVTRAPVTIDVKPVFEVDKTAKDAQKNKPSPVQATLIVSDEQQAQFVRQSAVSDTSLKTLDNSQQSKPLSHAIQSYQRAADVSLGPIESVIDEIV